MRKNYALLKQYVLALTLFTATTIVIYSCKKELYVSEKPDPAILEKNLAYQNGTQMTTINLVEFRTKVNQAALGTLKKQLGINVAPERLMGIELAETYKGFTLITDSIKMIKNGEIISYIFPVKLSSPHAVSFKNLTIVESTGGTSAFVTTYTPTIAWIKDWREGHSGKFDGSIVVTPLDLGNGGNSVIPNVSSTVKNKILSSLSPNTKISLAAPGCTEYTFVYQEPYKCGSGNHWPGDLNCTLTGAGAAGYANITSTMTICTGDGSGGGGGTTTPSPDPEYDPCPKTPPSIEFRGLRGERLAVAEGTPICDLQPLPPAPNLRDIRNKITDLCISKTVEATLKANKDVVGVMADIIKKFDASKSVQINIFDGHIYYKDKDGHDTNIPKPGQTANQTLYSNGKFSADITLGIDYLSNTSKENVIATLIHEVIHAYLKYNGDNTLSTTAQHNIIAEKYITPVASYLKETFNIPLKDAYALAWSGVSDSKVYNNLTPNDTEYDMSDGNKITAGEIGSISGAYKLSTNDPSNNGYTKGNKICN